MTREQKVNQVVDEIKTKMGSDYKVESRKVIKNNGIELTGISIIGEGENIAPQIYIDNMIYDSVSDIAESVIEEYRKYKNRMSFGNVSEIISDYTQIEDKLAIRLINRKYNEKMLAGIPYEEFLDLAIIATVDFSSKASAKVTNGLLSIWDKSFNDVISVAKKNFYASGMEFKSMEEVLSNMMEIPMEDMSNMEPPMYILTNKSKIYGAGFITSNAIMQKICDKLQSDLAVLPSSINEVIIVPLDDTTNYDDMSEMVQEINVSEVEPEEVLSDHAYIYKKETGWEI